MTTRLLTRDTIRAEHLAGRIGSDWTNVDNLLSGYSVAFGPVTELLFLQACPDATRLPEPPTPIDPVIIESRNVELLRERAPHRRADETVNVLELRTYDARPGQGAKFLELMLAALPVRERYSSNFGVWEAISGRNERVHHLWGYRDLVERDRVRGQLKLDPVWGKYISTVLPMLSNLNTVLLNPLPKA